jgi:hypothetical protein
MSPPSGYGPNPPGVRLPSLGPRVALAGLYLVFLLAISVGLPAVLFAELGQYSGHSGINPIDTTLGGTFVSVLAVNAFLLRPTRAYGPAAAARALATTAYLLFLVPLATVALPVASDANVTLGYAPLLEYLALVPLFSLAAALLITASDWREPYARLRIDYPG